MLESKIILCHLCFTAACDCGLTFFLSEYDQYVFKCSIVAGVNVTESL